MKPEETLIEKLKEIPKKTEANNFSEALSLIKEVKTADPKNIYLIAIEKQVTKLTDETLTSESKGEILRSLPAMIERAIGDIQRHIAQVKAEEQQKSQKEAALEKLKNQYFQRADEYVEKKEYQRALEEIRRIYIIEPNSIVAKEYEKKIEQLAALQARGEEPPKPEIPETKKVTEPTKISEKPIIEEKPKKSVIPLIAAAAVVVIAIGVWLITSQEPTDKQATSEQTTSSTTEGMQQPSQVTTEKPSEPTKPDAKSTSKTQPEEKKETKPTPEKKVTETPTTKPATPTQQPSQVQQQPAKKEETKPTTPVQTTTAPTTPPVSQPEKPAESPKTTEESTPAPMPFVAVESQPEIIKRVPAVYPEIAVKMGLEGRVTVEVTIDAQGKPIQAKVVKTTSDIFNDAAIEAVMKYQYKPAMMSTGPITAKLYIPITFTLKR